jgi:hypothetical protein
MANETNLMLPSIDHWFFKKVKWGNNYSSKIT